MDYIGKQNKLHRPMPQKIQLPQNRQWIRSLQVGDMIETDRNETLVVVRGLCRNSPTKDCIRVKRPHLKEPVTLRSCQEFDDCVEVVWSNHDGWKQSEFKNWRVVSPPLESAFIVRK
jgi:hypothetical protein